MYRAYIFQRSQRLHDAIKLKVMIRILPAILENKKEMGVAQIPLILLMR